MRSPLADAVAADTTSHEIVELARGLEGLRRCVDEHIAALIIGDRPLTDRLPLRRIRSHDGSSPLASQYAMRGVDDLGVLRLDLLCLHDLSALQDALDIVQASTGSRPDLRAIALDDPLCFEAIHSGQRVFGLADDRARRAARDIRPTCLADIAAIRALVQVRAAAHLLDRYADHKAHGYDAVAIGPLAEVLHDTHGLLLYVERFGPDAADDVPALPVTASWRQQHVLVCAGWRLALQPATALVDHE